MARNLRYNHFQRRTRDPDFAFNAPICRDSESDGEKDEARLYLDARCGELLELNETFVRNEYRQCSKPSTKIRLVHATAWEFLKQPDEVSDLVKHAGESFDIHLCLSELLTARAQSSIPQSMHIRDKLHYEIRSYTRPIYEIILMVESVWLHNRTRVIKLLEHLRSRLDTIKETWHQRGGIEPSRGYSLDSQEDVILKQIDLCLAAMRANATAELTVPYVIDLWSDDIWRECQHSCDLRAELSQDCAWCTKNVNGGGAEWRVFGHVMREKDNTVPVCDRKPFDGWLLRGGRIIVQGKDSGWTVADVEETRQDIRKRKEEEERRFPLRAREYRK